MIGIKDETMRNDHDVIRGGARGGEKCGLGLCLLLVLTLGAVPAWAAGTGVKAEPDWPSPVHDTTRHTKLMVDRLEYAAGDAEDLLIWDAQLWYGGDYTRLWIETEGEDVVAGGKGGELENFDVQYSRRFARFWDVQAGLGYQRRYGPGSDRDRGSALIGIQGLAPYWFEVDSNLRISDDGDVSADLEVEYDWRLTQRLILQPRFETALAFQDAEAFGTGQGITSVRTGLRLRYEIRRELAPYVGITWWRKFAETADLARAGGEDVDDTAVVAGVRAWF